MTDVFVSYKAEDRARVAPLVQALETDGLSVWWDEHIGGGDEWRETILRHLEAAKCVIVVWSRRSVGPHGDFVRDEASRAARRKTYCAVRIDKVDPPLGFGEMQVLDLAGWKGDRSDPRYQKVLAALHSRPGIEAKPARLVDAKREGVDRRAMLAGAAVVGAAAVGAGAWFFLKPAGGRSNSVAVLPFANLSGDPAQAYFSDGIAEEIRSALARLGGLTVIGRTSSEAVRNDDARTAARKLRVGNILTGSVRQSASTIRISAELIDGETGVDRWTQDYDRSPGDAIKIQTDIAENVAAALSAALGKAARSAIAVGGTQDPQAQKLLLQAVEAAHDLRKENVQRALSLLEAAIARDSRYAEAYARKGYLLEFYADNYAETLQEVGAYRNRALQAARTAIGLAPNLSAAHQALAQHYLGTLDLLQARREALRAVELAPGAAEPLSNYAFFLARFGSSDEAIRLTDKALALDPLNPGSYRAKFLMLYFGRRYADALDFTKQVESKSPGYFIWPEFAGCSSTFAGDLKEARRYLDLAPANDVHRSVCEIDLLIRTGRKGEAETRFVKFRELNGDTANYQNAEIYAQLGDADRAFAALDRAWAVRDTGLAWILIDPRLDPIRSDPRFSALLRTMNFPS